MSRAVYLLSFVDPVAQECFVRSIGSRWLIVWRPFGSLWLPFGSLWLLAGSLLVTIGSLLVLMGSLLLILALEFIAFGILGDISNICCYFK